MMTDILNGYIVNLIGLFAQTEELTFWENLLSQIIFFIILAIAMFVAQRLIDAFFNKYFERLYASAEASGRVVNHKRYQTLANAFRKMSSVAIWVVAMFVVLAHFNVNYAAILTGAGAVGIFFGIAGKDIVMDLYVGLMVLIEDQYRVGDVIWVAQDHSGSVEAINLRTVILRDIDGNIHIIPHSQAQIIKNLTYDFSRVILEVGVAYDTDIEKVKQVVNKVGTDMLKDAEINDQIIKAIHFDRVLRFDESQITIRAIGDVVAGKQWELSGVFNVKLKEAFDKNNIEIPYPQRTLHMVSEKS